MRYTSIDIIYNPNSTGPSHDLAKELRTVLAIHYGSEIVRLRATKYAGHAEKLAYKFALASKWPLIISSSGDGGYNEVINGALRAQQKGARPVCAVLAAGNANDHSRTLQDRPLADAILEAEPTLIDVLKITWGKSKTLETRYAHSYIGLGLTPVVAAELNKTNLNALRELWIVLKTFSKFRPFKIKLSDKILTLDSILFTNIGQMAKVLTVATNAKPNDGKFEVATFPHAHKLKLLRLLLKASTTGLKQRRQTSEYSFEVLKKMPVQLDGEVWFIEKNSAVVVTCARKMLQTIM